MPGGYDFMKIAEALQKKRAAEKLQRNSISHVRLTIKILRHNFPQGTAKAGEAS